MGAMPSNGARRFECLDPKCHWQGYRSLGRPTPCPRCSGPVHDVSLRVLGEARTLPPEKKRQQITCNIMPTTLQRLQKVRGSRTLSMTAAEVLDGWASAFETLPSVHAVALEQTARLSMLSAEHESLKTKHDRLKRKLLSDPRKAAVVRKRKTR